MIYIDLFGPFSLSMQDILYLLVVVDAFTKLTFLRSVRSTKTNVVVEAQAISLQHMQFQKC